MKYYGDRSKESLVSFAMQYVTSTVTELWAGKLPNQNIVHLHTKLGVKKKSGITNLLIPCLSVKDKKIFPGCVK